MDNYMNEGCEKVKGDGIQSTREGLYLCQELKYYHFNRKNDCNYGVDAGKMVNLVMDKQSHLL